VELFPAIDLRGGRCVRLARGDYAVETVYRDDPVAVAAQFAAAGATWIHVVDLDAARTGQPANRPVVAAIAAAVMPAGVRVQSGGGVRSAESAEALWSSGVCRVVLGTAAVEDLSLVARLARAHPGGVAVGLDSRAGEVAVRGWQEGSGLTPAGVLTQLDGQGVAAVIVTEIDRDGMLAGPDVEGLAAVLAAAPAGIDVIASGGVASADDVRALASLDVGGRRLAGAIVGRAIYEGRLSVAEGVAACAASG
jgi:phosphoribosylformimino-5-aminoimidazole carboxamide ribotide isomerase